MSMADTARSTQTADQPITRPIAYTAGKWPIHAWGIGAIASYFMYEHFYLINYIHTTVFRISPVIVGVVLALPRLVDGLLDPILGHWSDNLRSRWGRRRPFLLVSAFAGAIMASGLFWMSPDWPQWVKGCYLAFAAITLFTACGTYDMSHRALGYELSEDYADRSRIQAIRGVYWSLVCIIGGYVIWSASNIHTIGDFLFGAPPENWLGAWAAWRPRLLDAETGKTNEVLGFRLISAMISALILISVVFPILWSKERYVDVRRKHTDLRQALRATLKCRPFVLILVINIAGTAGTLSRNLFFFIGTYYVCHGDKAEFSRVMGGNIAVFGLATALVGWLVAKQLTTLIGKRMAFILGAFAGLVQNAMLPFIVAPGHLQRWFWLNVAFLPIGVILGAATAGIMPDICDLDELATGARREGMFTAVQAFVSKMEISVMTLLTGVFLAWTGFDAALPQQPQWVLHRMLWMGFAPLIVISAICTVLSCFMPVTASMMAKVRAELDARHAAAAAEGESRGAS
jgi:GPH family glycoside/pentoside/hexuronide:cation symporter